MTSSLELEEFRFYQANYEALTWALHVIAFALIEFMDEIHLKRQGILHRDCQLRNKLA